MAASRQDTLRKVEKLLRQGRLDAAIAEYAQVVEQHPTDWATANALGDLYLRANRIDQAIAQYRRIADHFLHEGFFPKAAALYKKILKVEPGEEAAQLHLAEASMKQGLLLEAKGCLAAVLEQRRQRGDLRAADEIIVRMAEVEPGEVGVRLAGAKALVNLGDTAAAIAWLNDLGTDLGESERFEEAVAVLRELVQLDPFNIASRAKLVRACLAVWDVTGAREYLTLEVAGDDPALLLTCAEVELLGGRHEQARQMLERVLTLSPDARDRVIALAWALCGASTDASFVCVDLVTDRAGAATDWDTAAAVMQEFVTRAPDHVPALLKLVEICADGGLEAPLGVAQAQLADVYLRDGHVAEARVIAEDLVAREPWERDHIARLRQALVALGESDPDALIADRLSEPVLTGGQDFATSAGDTSENVVPKDVSEQVQVEIEAAIDLPVTEQESVSDRAAGPESLLWSDAESGVLSDRPSVLGPDETSPGVFDLFQVVDDGPAVSAEQEIDLTSVLSDLSPEESTRAEVVPTSHEADAPVLSNETTPAPEGQPVHASANLQEVSQRLGEDVVSVVSQETDDATCGEQYQLGLTYRQMGMVDEAIQALEAAVRSPQHRFGAGLLLGRMYQERGMGGQAVAWLEIASQIPAPRRLKMAARCCTSSVRRWRPWGRRCARWPSSWNYSLGLGNTGMSRSVSSGCPGSRLEADIPHR